MFLKLFLYLCIVLVCCQQLTIYGNEENYHCIACNDHAIEVVRTVLFFALEESGNGRR